MATLDRNYSIYREHQESSFEKHPEWRYDFMRSSKAKQMREDVDMTKVRME